MPMPAGSITRSSLRWRPKASALATIDLLAVVCFFDAPTVSYHVPLQRRFSCLREGGGLDEANP